jgi:hypothetical protein
MKLADMAPISCHEDAGSRIAERPAMVRARALLVAFLVSLAGPAVAFAQQPPEDPGSRRPGLLRNIKVDQGGGFLLSRHFGVVFGGIKQGSGMAAGPAVSWELPGGAYAQIKSAYSIHNFKLLQGRYDSAPLFGARSMWSTRLRWQDAPQLPLYEAGPDSPNQHVEYGTRRTEWSAFLKTTVQPKTTVTVGSGIERYASSQGWLDPGEDERLAEVPDAPGIGTQPWFFHSFVSLARDSRLSPDFSRTGNLLEAAVHAYHDAHDGTQSFRRITLAAYELVPTWAQKGALGFGARAWLSDTGDRQQVPFFLMPTLGGGDYLRGYSSYRFRDRNALLLQAEYRYAVHPMIDVAALYEAGTVSSTIGGLSLGNAAQSAGAGLRVHTKTSGLLRVDLARGRDGLKVAFGVGIGGS